MASRLKITVIGGGTGSFTILSGLKHLEVDLTALVNMVDDGGSTGQLRDDFGVLPPGDIRQCLVALSDAPMSLRELFNFRFPGDTSLGGHSFGNLFLSAVEMMTDNFSEAVTIASNILNIKGRVLPVTTEKCQLALETPPNDIIGQVNVEQIDIVKGSKPKLYLKPAAKLNPEAKKAIKEADLIVIAPGSLYSSIISALIVEGMAESLKTAKAKVVYICNLINKPNHTKNFCVTDFVSELERFVGNGVIDYVIYNTDMPDDELLSKYSREEEFPVEADSQEFNKYSPTFIPARLLSRREVKQDKSDAIKRSVIRHNSIAVAQEVERLINKLFN